MRSLLLAAALATTAPPAHDPQFESYRAHIAAAHASLRLNETGEARRWLEGAPSTFRNWEWRYLMSEAEHAAATFEGNGGAVLAIAVSPDGRLVASGGTDRTLRLRDARTGGTVATIDGFKAAIQSIAFSSDGSRVAAVASGQSVRIFDAPSWTETRQIQGQGRGLSAIAFSPDGALVASCSWNRTRERGVFGIVDVWDARTAEPVRHLESGSHPLVDIEFSPDGKRLAIATWQPEGDVVVWDTTSWAEPLVLRPADSPTYKATQSIAFSPNGGQLISGHKDAFARIWNLGEGRLERELAGHSKWVNGVAFLRGDAAVTVSTDQTVRVWKPATGEQETVLRGHALAVQAVAADHAGGRVFTGSADGTVRVFDLGAHAPNRKTWRAGRTVWGIAFSDGGSRAWTADESGAMNEREVASGAAIRSFAAPTPSSSLNAIVVSSAARRAVTVGNDGAVRLWDLTTTERGRVLDQTQGFQLVALAMSPDGRRVIAASNEGFAKIWDLGSGVEIRRLGHERNVRAVAWSPDGRAIATGSADGTLTLWDAADGTVRVRRAATGPTFHSLAFSGDSRRLAAAAGDRAVLILDASTGATVASLAGHDDFAYSVSWSPDGSRLATASQDQTVRLWDTRTGSQVLSIPSESQYYGAFFSPDGVTLATLPMDGTVRILTARER